MEDTMKQIAESIRINGQTLEQIFTSRAPDGIEDLDEILIRDILSDFNIQLADLTGDLDIDFTEAANFYDNTNVQIMEILEESRLGDD